MGGSDIFGLVLRAESPDFQYQNGDGLHYWQGGVPIHSLIMPLISRQCVRRFISQMRVFLAVC
jgi:hypothetical protein